MELSGHTTMPSSLTGLSRYGLKEQANRIFQGIFDAALRFDLQRLPELFCGFAREEGYGARFPYPVAATALPRHGLPEQLLCCCSRRSESKSLAFMARIIFNQPTLPDFLHEIRITGLPIRGTKIDLVVRGERNHVTVGAEGDVSIQIIKPIPDQGVSPPRGTLKVRLLPVRFNPEDMTRIAATQPRASKKTVSEWMRSAPLLKDEHVKLGHDLEAAVSRRI